MKLNNKRPKTIKELEDKIMEWHNTFDTIKIHDYLGWTWQEYAKWVETSNPPKDVKL